MTQKILTWKAAYDEMRDIAGEAIGLADAYAGGDSDNAKELNRRYEELDLSITNNPPASPKAPKAAKNTDGRIYRQVPKGYYAVEAVNHLCVCEAGTCAFYRNKQRGVCSRLKLRCYWSERRDGLSVIFKKDRRRNEHR